MQTFMPDFEHFEPTVLTAFLASFVPIQRRVLFRQPADGGQTAPVTVHYS